MITLQYLFKYVVYILRCIIGELYLNLYNNKKRCNVLYVVIIPMHDPNSRYIIKIIEMMPRLHIIFIIIIIANVRKSAFQKNKNEKQKRCLRTNLTYKMSCCAWPKQHISSVYKILQKNWFHTWLTSVAHNTVLHMKWRYLKIFQLW